MREATGSSMLLYVVIIVVGIVMLLFVSIISYAKAYVAKNKIVSAIESAQGYKDDERGIDATKEIDAELAKMGYTVTSNDFCQSERVKTHLNNLGITKQSNLNNSSKSKYGYCVYKVEASNQKRGGEYYVIVTFINFNVPFIGERLVFPVYGQTKLLNVNYLY